MLSVSWRTGTDVYRHVEYGSLDDAHQFALGKWRLLKMEASHNPVGRETFVVLNKGGSAYLFFEFTCRETFEEITSGVVENSGFQDKYPFYWGLDYIHTGQILIGFIPIPIL